MRVRFYDQSSGRFTSADKLPGSAYDPSSLHRYAYAKNNPVDRIDPTGYWSTADTIAAVTIIGILAGSAITMMTLNAMTYYYLPKEHFNRWPDAVVGGVQVNVSASKFVAQHFAGPWAEAVAAGLLLTTGSVGAEVMWPVGTPEVWVWGFAGPTFSVNSDLVDDLWNPSGQVTFNPYFGAAWNVHSPDDYSKWFFCSQGSKQIVKEAITRVNFKELWSNDTGPNWRDPLSLSASLCLAPKDDPNTAYSLTFGRDQIFSNPSWSFGSAAYYYRFAKSFSFAKGN